MNNVYTNAPCIYYFSNIAGYKNMYDRKYFKIESAIYYWIGNAYYGKWRKQFAEFKKILLALVKVNQHFRDHTSVHHQGSDVLT
jgi:hypothetical protein